METKIKRFTENVLSKYSIYNSLFMTLPFKEISNTGAYLLLLRNWCEKGFEQAKNPTEIIDSFFEKYLKNSSEKQKEIILFRFIQYIERQVVLFDAVEDAAFSVVHNMAGLGTLRNLKEELEAKGLKEKLQSYLKKFNVRIVLTAHPTQFYPGAVLSIMTDLQSAVRKNELPKIKELLAQLGKTQFFSDKKPSPYDEAVSLIWYLENVFYKAIGTINDYVRNHIFQGEYFGNALVHMGFWPGGDRDGNPFVTTEITLRVARKLRHTILKNYYREAKALRKRLTFSGVYEKIIRVETQLYQNFIDPQKQTISLETLKNELDTIRKILVQKHQGLFLEKLDSFIAKIHIFGYHFAGLDIRQDSRMHHEAFVEIVKTLQKNDPAIFPKNYLKFGEQEQIECLSHIKADVDLAIFKDDLVLKTLGSIKALQKIQKENGEQGCHRYIISNNQTALNVMEVFAMLHLCGFENEMPVDIMPLFETVNDLKNSENVMKILYKNPIYRKHLQQRKDTQSIMLGFSDGTKDGGYLMANWAIFKAKESLTEISKEMGIKVIFFDGRGGPPARGGGKTSKFYASLGPTIASEQIQLTVQGQTISSNFGNTESCRYNIEQLLGAGISNALLKNKEDGLMKPHHRAIMDDLTQTSYQTYVAFKNHPMFLPYLEHMSTLKYYGKTNIGSRPTKRSAAAQLNFGDLRAIPFVGSWSQLKQNVPGFFGVGTALKKYDDNGTIERVKTFYKENNFFKTLLENSAMSLAKSFFELTAYMKEDRKFGAFWTLIYEEFLLTKKMLLKVTEHTTLMENYPDGKASIEARESIALPLLTIQQYALKMIQTLKKEDSNNPKIKRYEKIVTRSLFGNINASRNSA